MHIHASGGGRGIWQFSARTMLYYAYSQVDGRATLSAAILLRSAGPIRELEHRNPVTTAAIRKLCKERFSEPGTGVSGTVCGPHNILIARQKQIVVLDLEREIALGACNVLMLDNIEVPCPAVTIAGLDRIDIDLSREYLVLRATYNGHDLDSTVAEALKQSPSVRTFCT